MAVKHTRERFELFAYTWDVARAWEMIGDRPPNHTVDPHLWEREVVEQWGTADGLVFEDLRAAIDHARDANLVDQRVGGSGFTRTVDVARAMSDEVDVGVPVIVAPLPEWLGGGHMLLDGGHRVYKAIKLGLDAVPMHLLAAAEEERVRVWPVGDDAARMKRRFTREQKRRRETQAPVLRHGGAPS